MKDAFNKKLAMSDKVIYSVDRGPGGTIYVIGEVIELIPSVEIPGALYYPPDRVRVKPIKANKSKPTTNPLLYAINVVKISALKV